MKKTYQKPSSTTFNVHLHPLLAGSVEGVEGTSSLNTVPTNEDPVSEGGYLAKPLWGEEFED